MAGEKGLPLRQWLKELFRAKVPLACHKHGKLENDILGSWKEEEQELYLELTNRYLLALKQKIKDEL